MQLTHPTLKGRFGSPRFALWLAAFFVFAQLLTSAHSAAYGDADHLHDGHPCIVASIVKKSGDMDVAPAPIFVEPQDAHYAAPAEPTLALIGRITATGTIRGPPLSA